MIYEIRNTGMIVGIDSLGAQLVSILDYSGTEFIWQRDEKYWASSSPVLFPIVGRLEKDTYELDGKKYNMKIHGIARNEEFKVIFQSENRIIFFLSSNESTKKSYPFDFSLIIMYTLEEYTLNVRFEISNMDGKPMPFSIGAHPGFNIPLSGHESFEDYSIIFEKEENASIPAVDESFKIDFGAKTKILENEKEIKLDHELFKSDALIFENLKSNYLVLSSRKSGRGIKFGFGDFPYLGIWQKYGADTPFICLEPWHGIGMCADDTSFEAKRGMITLPAGESKSFNYSITVI